MQRCWLVTTALLLLPAATLAEQLEYGLRSQAGWTDNVYGTGDDSLLETGDELVAVDRVDDYSVRLSPWGKLSDPDGRFTWSLRYQPSYEYYLQESELRDFDHDANAELAWRVGDRTTLFLTEAFQQYRSLVRFNENLASPTDPAVLRSRRDKILGNATTLGMRNFLTRIDSLTTTLNYNTRDFEDEFSVDRSTFSLASLYLRDLSQRTSIGIRGYWIQQAFQRQIGDENVTDYYNLSGVFEHEFSRTLSLELSAGPTLIDSGAELVNFSPKYGAVAFRGSVVALDAETCRRLNPFQAPDPATNPYITGLNFSGCDLNSTRTLSPGELQAIGYRQGSPLVPGSAQKGAKLTGFEDPYTLNSDGELVPLDATGFGDTEVTYFARAALIKDWERWHAQLSYERANDDSGSFGTSSVQDSLELALRWEPTQLWTVSLTGAYTLIDQATDAAIPSGLVVANEAAPVGVDNVTQLLAVQRVIADVSDDALSYNSASVSLTANRRLTENSSLFAALYWYRQEQSVELDEQLSFIPGVTSDDEVVSRFHTLTLWVGIDWHFDTIKF